MYKYYIIFTMSILLSADNFIADCYGDIKFSSIEDKYF